MRHAGSSDQRWDLGTDRVNAANLCDWLVAYYLEHDRREESLAIAEAAGEAYSIYGLDTLMRTYERLGRLEDAQEIGKALDRRYDDLSPLFGLYYRNQSETTPQSLRDEYDRLLKQYFPTGTEHASFESFSKPPLDGALFPTEVPRMREAGMKKNCVVVAIDGIRVRNFDQYAMARLIDTSPVMDLIVWQEGRYVEIKASRSSGSSAWSWTTTRATQTTPQASRISTEQSDAQLESNRRSKGVGLRK